METKLSKSELLEVSEIQLTYRNKVKLSLRPTVSKSKDAAKILRQNWNEDTIEFIEEFRVMFLNRANQVLGISLLSTGGQAGTTVDPKIVFAAALKANAATIVISHNHPSGQLKPSDADLGITKRLVQAGLFLDLPVVDHIILTSEGYYSFADNGLI